MTPPQKTEPSPTLTLLELLAQAEILAIANAALTRDTPDLSEDCRAFAAQFRSAAERLEREVRARKTVAIRINGGPLNPTGSSK